MLFCDSYEPLRILSPQLQIIDTPFSQMYAILAILRAVIFEIEVRSF